MEIASCIEKSCAMIRKALIIWISLVALAIADDDSNGKGAAPGSYYKYSQLGVVKSTLAGQSIKMTFRPVGETFHWCPGIKIDKTKKATIVTFVRAKTSANYNVTVKATIGTKLIRNVTIPTYGMPTYVRSGPKSFKKLWAPPKKGKGKSIKNKQPEKKKPGSEKKKPGKEEKKKSTAEEESGPVKPSNEDDGE